MSRRLAEKDKSAFCMVFVVLLSTLFFFGCGIQGRTVEAVNPGHSVFDVNSVNIYTPKTTSFSPYLVRVAIPDLNIRKGLGTDYSKTGKYTGIGTFTIVEETKGKGASKWRLLKS